MTLKQFCSKVGHKTEAEWVSQIRECRDRTRSWVQAHGEVAAFFGFVAGILMVIFFRIFAWIFFLLAVVAGIIWLRSPKSLHSQKSLRSPKSQSDCCGGDCK